MKKTTKKIGIRPTPFDSLQTHLKVNMWAVGCGLWASNQNNKKNMDSTISSICPHFFEKKERYCRVTGLSILLAPSIFGNCRTQPRHPLKCYIPSSATQLRVSSRKPSSWRPLFEKRVNDNPNQLIVLTSFS